MTKSNSAENAQPFSIRLTKTEKDRLRERAGTIPLGIFIRNVVLGGEQAVSRAVRHQPLRNADSLGRLLGLLGQSRLASNLNQIAKAANLGALPVTAELEADLRQACAEVFEMRCLLLTALGVQIVSKVASVTETFSEVAGGPAQ